MVAEDQLDEEAMDDSTVAYIAETGDESVFGNYTKMAGNIDDWNDKALFICSLVLFFNAADSAASLSKSSLSFLIAMGGLCCYAFIDYVLGRIEELKKK